MELQSAAGQQLCKSVPCSLTEKCDRSVIRHRRNHIQMGYAGHIMDPRVLIGPSMLPFPFGVELLDQLQVPGPQAFGPVPPDGHEPPIVRKVNDPLDDIEMRCRNGLLWMHRIVGKDPLLSFFLH